MSDPAAQRIIDRIDFSRRGPTVLAYGVGVDSTAILVELEARGSLPDLVLTADTGTEKPETYEYQAMIAAWMAQRGIPYEVVRYVPKRFKHWPPYFSLLERPDQCHLAQHFDGPAQLLAEMEGGSPGRLSAYMGACTGGLGGRLKGRSAHRLRHLACR